jgi:hypothetical protein
VSLSSPLGSGGSCHGGAWPTVGARGSLAGSAPCIERILAPPASSVEGGRDGGAPCLCPGDCCPFHGGFWTRRREKAVRGPPDGCGVRRELLWLWRQPRLEVYSSSLSYFHRYKLQLILCNLVLIPISVLSLIFSPIQVNS